MAKGKGRARARRRYGAIIIVEGHEKPARYSDGILPTIGRSLNKLPKWTLWAAGGLGLYAIYSWLFGSVDPRSNPTVLPMTVDDFTSTVMNAVQAVDAEDSEQIQLMIVAHAAYESGWGRSTAAQQGNNLFNITRLPSDPGPIVTGGDTEYESDGSVRKITQRWAAYGSIGEGITDYLSFLQHPRYLPAYLALKAGNASAFVTALHAGGYFTLPVDQYLANYQSVLRRVTNSWNSQTAVA